MTRAFIYWPSAHSTATVLLMVENLEMLIKWSIVKGLDIYGVSLDLVSHWSLVIKILNFVSLNYGVFGIVSALI